MQVQLQRSKPTLIEQFTNWLETSPSTLLVSICVLYWVEIYFRIQTKAIWYDELFTLYVSQLGGIDKLWSALRAGIDNQPPLFYMITAAMQSVFTDQLWIVRMPQAIATFVTYIALYLLLRGRFGVIHSVSTILLMRLLGAQYYAAEGRPYASVLAGATVAWLCYTRIDESKGMRALAWTCGMGVALAFSNAHHYYGGLALVPIAAAELIRSFDRGWRWAPWIALAASLAPYLVLLQFKDSLFGYKEGFPSKPSVSTFQQYWEAEAGQFTMRLFPLFIGVTLSSFWFAHFRTPREEAETFPFDRNEMVGIAVFCILPLIALIAGKLITGLFVLRYAIPTLVGWALLFGMWLWRETHWNKPATLSVLSFLLLMGFGIPFASKAMAQPENLWGEIITTLEKTEGDIVVEFGTSYLELYDAAPTTLKPRLVYLANEELARANMGTDVFDRGLKRLGRSFPLRIADTRLYCNTHSSFLILRTDNNQRGAMNAVANQGRALYKKFKLPNHTLWRVEGAQQI